MKASTEDTSCIWPRARPRCRPCRASRRRILSGAAGLRIIVGFPPGATADTLARLMGQWLSERLSQPVIHREPAERAPDLAAEVVVRAPADGHTLLLTTSVEHADNNALLRKAQFQFHSATCTTGARYQPRAACHGSDSSAAVQGGSRVHRLCQG